MYGAKRKIGRWPKRLLLDETEFSVTSSGSIGIISLGDACSDELCTKKFTFLDAKQSVILAKWMIDANNFILINTGRFEK